MEHTRQFRPLSELNLMDNFLFHEMLLQEDVQEEFCRILLKTILNKEVRHVKVTPQKTILGADTNKHGIRFDAYIEAVVGSDSIDADVVPDIYDIEPNRTYERETLPKRMRYYHGMIDSQFLQAGQTYDKLPNVVIIFILPYDPFGKDRMVYTIRNEVLEEPDIEYNDGALKMILYTKGKTKDSGKELQDMLKYMEESTADNVTNQDIESVHHLVNRVKARKEVDLNYMKSWEWDDYNKKLGIQEGIKLGRSEGIEIGRDEERTNSIRILIMSYKKFNASDQDILAELMSNFNLTQEEAQKYLERNSK